MLNVDEQIELYRDEANVDFLSLGYIAGNVSFDIGSKSLGEVRPYTMQIVTGLMEQGVCPGNYTLESLQREGFSFWSGTPQEIRQRIESAWDSLNCMPNDDDICWFALKPSDKALAGC